MLRNEKEKDSLFIDAITSVFVRIRIFNCTYKQCQLRKARVGLFYYASFILEILYIRADYLTTFRKKELDRSIH